MSAVALMSSAMAGTVAHPANFFFQMASRDTRQAGTLEGLKGVGGV